MLKILVLTLDNTKAHSVAALPTADVADVQNYMPSFRSEDHISDDDYDDDDDQEEEEEEAQEITPRASRVMDVGSFVNTSDMLDELPHADDA